ncbi:MAG: sigma-70 family RNA polymerase sigma factor [Planctomycetes bacterium]|nr:sigma-70 family RNA polymerase sigma factor [Planctomycetota bacterium]
MPMVEEAGAPISELIERWVAGDAAAAEEIYQRYYARAWRFGKRLLRRDEDAEEVAQQALASGLEGLKGGARPERFTGWILGIVRHAALKGWKIDRRERATESLSLPAKGGPRTELVQREMEGILQEALARLDEHDQRIVELRVVQKMKREDVAPRLGMSLSTLDRHLERALTNLREALSRHFTTLVLFEAPREGPITWASVQELRPSFRRAFEVRHLEEASLEETAARLGAPVATVEARLKHAYEQLRCGPDDDFSTARAEWQARRNE